MKQYDKIIIVSCSNAQLMSKISDALLSTFQARFKKKLSFYEDILVFNSAGSFVTGDVLNAISECKTKGETPLVFAYVHTEPKCRGTRIYDLKDEILATFKDRLKWSPKDVSAWCESYGFTSEALFGFDETDAKVLVQNQARLISSTGVDFICGVLNFKTGVLSSLLHNISLSSSEQEMLKKAIFKEAVTPPKTIVYKKPTYLVLSYPGVNSRRLLKITRPGVVYPVTVNPKKVDIRALASIALFISIMADDPRVRIVAAVDKIKELEDWVDKDVLIQALYATGIRKPTFYIRA